MPTPNLTDVDMQALKTELATDPTGRGYAGMTAAQKALALIDRPMIPNPQPAPQVPKPFTTAELMNLIDAIRRGVIAELPTAIGLKQDIAAQNRTAIKNWAMLLADGGKIMLAERDAIFALMDATIPDPNHPAMIPGENRATVVCNRVIAGMSADEINAVEAS